MASVATSHDHPGAALRRAAWIPGPESGGRIRHSIRPMEEEDEWFVTLVLVVCGLPCVLFLLRLKYNVMGPKGHANVYLEVVDGAPKHEYVYLIVEFTDLGEVVKIIDNRKEADSIETNSTAIIDGREPE
ncbi:hypothetical protein ATCC90586_006114 [Pythium insidiosum]|nr:hypothetical protein ATCC90586_006114 [Pythium insidiosum]